MNKYNNPRLLNTVVSGTGMKNPVRPHVIIGSEENGFIRGDLMDANAVKEAVAKEVAERIDADLNLSEEIDTKVRQAVDDLVDGAPEVLDTLKELSEAIGDDENFITTMTEQLSEKVDKVEGKDLSTNDYTTAEKQKLAGIATGAEVNVQADWSLTNSSNDAFIKNKPTKLSQFENDIPYATESELMETKNIVDTVYSVLPTTANGYEYVDLGLPSGTLWATKNVGADDETDFGNYFMWGKGNTVYSSTDPIYTTTNTYLDSSVDTATVMMGGNWHMPKKAQLDELIANTTSESVTNYNNSGVSGILLHSNINNNTLFLPYAGSYDQGSYMNSGLNVWSSERYSQLQNYAYFLSGFDGTLTVYNFGYERGFSVRGVIDSLSLLEVPSKEEIVNKDEVIAAALNDLNIRINTADQNLEDIQTSISDVESYCDYIKKDIIDEHEFVIAEAITKLKTKLDEANIKLEDINSELEDIDAIRLRTIFTPAPVDPGETIQIFDGSSTIDELEDIVTNTNTRKFLTTVRGNKTLIVGFVDFFTDWAGHQITAVATSNIHLDEWDNESDLTLVPHTDGKANIYVAYCGLHDPAGYSGLVEGEWTSWKKFNTDVDDLRRKATEIIDRSKMPVSTFLAIFTDASVDDLKWIINNYDPVFYIMSEGNTSYPVGNGLIFASNDFSMITVVVTTPYAYIPNFSGSYASPPVVASIFATINGDNVSWNNWVALYGNLSNGLA